MFQIDSGHRKISTDRHFPNAHHNTAKIQHCPISSKFDMWVDYDDLIDSRHRKISKVALDLFFKPVVWPVWETP